MKLFFFKPFVFFLFMTLSFLSVAIASSIYIEHLDKPGRCTIKQKHLFMDWEGSDNIRRQRTIDIPDYGNTFSREIPNGKYHQIILYAILLDANGQEIKHIENLKFPCPGAYINIAPEDNVFIQINYVNDYPTFAFQKNNGKFLKAFKLTYLNK